jgi:hypothetical protein
MKHPIYLLAALLLVLIRVEAINYGIVYVITNTLAQPIADDTIIIEEKNRYNTNVKISPTTKKFIQSYSQHNQSDQASSATDVKSLPKNKLVFTKSLIPQITWVGTVQLITVEFDIASLLQGS